MASKAQTLVFSRSKFTETSAKKWARDHDFKGGKADVGPKFIRIRQATTSALKKQGFTRFRFKKLASGVNAVFAFKGRIPAKSRR